MCRKEGPREHPPGRAGRGRPGQPPVDWSTYLVTSCRLLVPARGVRCSIVVPVPRSPPRPTQRLRRGSCPTSRRPLPGEGHQQLRPDCKNTLRSAPRLQPSQWKHGHPIRNRGGSLAVNNGSPQKQPTSCFRTTGGDDATRSGDGALADGRFARRGTRREDRRRRPPPYVPALHAAWLAPGSLLRPPRPNHELPQGHPPGRSAVSAYFSFKRKPLRSSAVSSAFLFKVQCPTHSLTVWRFFARAASSAPRY